MPQATSQQAQSQQIKYQVKRSFSDGFGTMTPGYLPSPERAATWAPENVRAMVSCGDLEIISRPVEASGAITPPVAPPSTASTPSAPDAKPANKRRRNKRRARGGGQSCTMPGCNWTGERLNSHLVRAHKE